MSTPPETLNPNPNPSESWTIVSHRRNLKQSKPNPNPNPNPLQFESLTLKTPIPWSPLDSQINPNLQSKLLYKIQSSLNKLKSSQFHSQFLAQLQSPQVQSGLDKILSFHPQFHLVIYGIGSIDSFETPRLQLALALVLYEQLKRQISSVEVFDPIISATERATMEELGVTVMAIDERGRREGLLAAHRGGYMDSQREEGPAPLLWRFSDFLKWAELCPSEPEIGHALMHLMMTGQEIPHACEGLFGTL